MTRIFQKLANIMCVAALALGAMGLSPAIERLAVPKSDLIDARWTAHAEDDSQTVDHSGWSVFLQTYVSEDESGVARVDYGAVTPEDRASLGAYLSALQSLDPAGLNRDEQLAYWTNLYNARTVELILEHYPVDSIRKIKFKRFANGPWNEPMVEVNGVALSLNDIESGIVRPIWEDPRIHYIFNCAAVGCPNLGQSAYTGDDIDAQMDAAARAYINNPRGVQIDESGDLILSKIFAWYKSDFGGSRRAALNHVRQYADEELLDKLADHRRADSHAYDWTLNDAAAP